MDDAVSAAGHSALRLASQPRQQFHLLQQVHDAVLSGAPAALRPLVSESWQRSLAAQVNPEDYRPPIVYSSTEVTDVRDAHPLHSVLPLLRSMLVEIADACQHIMIVTDGQGTILWREGARDLCRHADPVGLCEGTRWSEEAIGTNAMGTALAVGTPVHIYSAEHLVRTYQTWSCAAAPVHDPEDGTLLGAVDISGYLQSLHPAAVTLVAATAQLAEGHLRMQMAVRDERVLARNMAHLRALRGEPGALLAPSGRVLAAEPYGQWPTRIRLPAGQDEVLLPDGRRALVEPLPEGYLIRMPQPARAVSRLPALSLSFLREQPVAVLDGRELPLTLRRAELLGLLALHPGGLTAEQLALQLYGDEGNPTTVRAEIHRLRAQLRPSMLWTKPYRLHAQLDADFLDLRATLQARDVRAVLPTCQAPLLPRSDAPAIRAERDALSAGMRTAVLAQRDVETLWRFGQCEPGQDDLEVFDRLAVELPPHDPRQGLAEARRQWLLAEEA